ncbi:hypothetical protein [Peredibacter starrii]|uniref:Yip1 domain-containing protein n=1 Tax=Peredibacter starrii TaxID=28202 RepID=A0AAX4HTB6_9BACT|nr:hypothetical protein [Peredibacter starrii]WPU66241.1 hypothetical protein SOO65_05730 [Peredibacter starrii]
MKTMGQLIETYLTVLVHPFRIHQQFRHQLSLPEQGGVVHEPLTLPEALGISWIFAIMRGLCKIIILNYFLQSFLNMQSESFPFLQEMLKSSGSSTYYFLLFSAALDIIFFPIATIVLTEFWAWVIRKYSGWLNPDLPAEEIADQITTHALSSNLFNIIPFIGDLIQSVVYYFLMYAGLRSNLGASRSLAWVILLTPTIFGLMLLSLLFFTIFYLVA